MGSNLAARMPNGRILAWHSLALITALVGCRRDLGECNLDGQTPDGHPLEGPAAFDIAYRLTDGLPMYEGQALVQSSCGNGQFCHSPVARGSDRVGVPAGLNFDVALACADETVDATCAQPIESCEDGEAQTAYCERLQRLYSNQDEITRWSEGMIQEMRSGAMPPGAAGRAVRDPTPWIRGSDGTPLPDIESDEGREIVRNWLACQAPVIARTEVAPSEADQLTPCASVDDEICVYGGPQGDLPEPAWGEIYWSLLFTRCVACHGPANGNVDENPDNPLDGQIPGGASPAALAALDLTGSNTVDTTDWPTESWSAVVDAPAADPGMCAGQGTIVIPLDPEGSIMVRKMRAMQSCGDEMPPAGGSQTIGDPLIEVVEEWINLGAPNN
jgi:hypothetical protein